MNPFEKPEHIQGSAEWLAHRKNHIGASDAVIIMGVSPWSTPMKLWEQKVGVAPPIFEHNAMKRGSLLEDGARLAFEADIGIEVFPQVVYHPEHTFMMSSLDGISLEGQGEEQTLVEIKCPSEEEHKKALDGNVPEHYVPQLQHQLACTGLEMLWYYSFDGVKGVKLAVKRDDEYIAAMIEKEKEFWGFMKSKTPPPFTNRDYKNRPDWEVTSQALSLNAGLIVSLKESLKKLEGERDEMKAELVAKADGQSSKCGFVSIGRSFPRGRVDYGAIPELKGVDLDQYRKESKETWTLRIKTER